MVSCKYSSPIGTIIIMEDNGALVKISYQRSVDFDKKETVSVAGHGIENKTLMSPVLRETIKQLEEYFHGTRREFQLPLKFNGTEFQQKVWKALLTIPYGETRSYSQIAEQIGQPKAARAVGMANNKNPLMIVVPCHRVIGKDKSMTGYACGIDVKEALLRLEGSR